MAKSSAPGKRIKLPKLKKSAMDYQFLGTVIVLLAFGLIMILSASSPVAYASYNDSFYYFKKQLIWAIIGGIAMLVASNFEYTKLKKYGKLARYVASI